MIAECAKGCTKLRKSWRNICSIMLNIALTNALNATKDSNNPAILINICERTQMNDHSLVRCAANPSSKLASSNNT